ncbi:MAG: hypothetical protein QOF51_497 [Chloroflexota bacterium]|jgi:hypothetical protein|nr:hypothetical protein [Chloroflexota bacterium]
MDPEELKAYDDYLADHLDELVDQYAGKAVAIFEGRVLTVGETETDVYRWVHDAGLPRMPFVLRVPREHDFENLFI